MMYALINIEQPHLVNNIFPKPELNYLIYYQMK